MFDILDASIQSLWFLSSLFALEFEIGPCLLRVYYKIYWLKCSIFWQCHSLYVASVTIISNSRKTGAGLSVTFMAPDWILCHLALFYLILLLLLPLTMSIE